MLGVTVFRFRSNSALFAWRSLKEPESVNVSS
jgi:hypothetical protein